MNLSELFAVATLRSPEKIALRFRAADRPVDLTFAELDAAVGRLARVLAARGLRHGDRFALFLGNRPEFVVGYLAAIRLGAVVVPINLAYRRREVAHILADAEPRLLLTEAAQTAVLDELEPAERGSLEGVLLAEELSSLGDTSAATSPPPELPPVQGDDLALLLYTSGTTGRSKGAMLSHDNVLATVTALLAAWEWSAEDVMLLTLPLFHTHGLVVGLHCALAAGATVLLRRRFDAAETLAELRAGEPTLFFGVPTMYSRLVEELRREPGLGPRCRVRLFCSGSAALSAETFAAFRELTGQVILERYGMTETGMLLSNPYSVHAGERLPGTVGTPLPGVSARIVGAAGEVLPDGEEGELLVRGANVFRGYWRAPEKTAESFATDEHGESWFRTGDLARRDPQTGHITLLGRRHELIIRGGFNIYPREIEEVLLAFPGVREVAVAGRPHADLGEVPVAFVVAERTIEERDLVAHCKQQLAAFKAPHAVRFVESLPRNALGKVQKHLLPRD